jgi:hypothetical protein
MLNKLVHETRGLCWHDNCTWERQAFGTMVKRCGKCNDLCADSVKNPLYDRDMDVGRREAS